MPNIPKSTTLNTEGGAQQTTMNILNAIRSHASLAYQDRVPTATQDTINDAQNAIISYTATTNEFLNALVNRIVKVLIESMSYKNPLRAFKRGILRYGETVEQIYVAIAKAHPFNPAKAESDVFKREIPDVVSVFHKMDYQNFYKRTIEFEELRLAFLAEGGLLDLIGRIVDSMYSGSEVDEFIIMKNQLGEAITKGRMYPVNVPAVTATTAAEVVATIKEMSDTITFPKTKYNYAGQIVRTDKNNQILLTIPAVNSKIDVHVLAEAFNMDKAEFLGHQVLVDDFGTADDVVAVLIDKDWYMVFDNLMQFTENYNGEGLYWNYFYHVWKTFSYSPFANAIVFTTKTPTVTGVTVDPTTVSIAKGGHAKINATVAATNYGSTALQWSITETNISNKTYVDWTGNVYIGGDETNTTLHVVCKSIFNESATATTTVTVTG